MSYTDFKWRFVDATKSSGSEIEADEKLTLQVEVTNVGEYKGKDVVQIYLTAPYTPGGIEKSFRKLVGYEKTPLLQPGETCTIDIEVDTKDFKSYDDYDANGNAIHLFPFEKKFEDYSAAAIGSEIKNSYYYRKAKGNV